MSVSFFSQIPPNSQLSTGGNGNGCRWCQDGASERLESRPGVTEGWTMGFWPFWGPRGVIYYQPHTEWGGRAVCGWVPPPQLFLPCKANAWWSSMAIGRGKMSGLHLPTPTPQAMVPVPSSCLRSWTARLLLSTLRGCRLAQVDVALEATRISLSWENLTHGKWNLQNQEVKVWPLLTKRFLPDSYKQWTFPESIFSVPQFAQNIS